MPRTEGANGAAAAERPLDDVNACEGGGAGSGDDDDVGADSRRILEGRFRREFVARQSATTSHMRWSTSTSSIPSIHVVSSANDEEFCLDSAPASRSSPRMLSRDAKSMEHSRTKRGCGAGRGRARRERAPRRRVASAGTERRRRRPSRHRRYRTTTARACVCAGCRGDTDTSATPRRSPRTEPPPRSKPDVRAEPVVPFGSGGAGGWRSGRIARAPGGDAAAFARIEDPASTRTERSHPGGEGRRETRASSSAVGRRCRWLGFWETGGLPARAGIALCVVPSTARAPLPPLTSESGPAHMARYS